MLDEGQLWPAISVGLRDFIGTGWYTSEYIVGTKTIGQLELTAGIGYGRLAGRNAFSNPLGIFSSALETRGGRNVGLGGTLGSSNWFQGDASTFFGATYKLSQRVFLSGEYTSDLMALEERYLNVKSPWNFGLKYKFNDYITVSAEYLYGSRISATASVNVNPGRPPLIGGKELAPVPMRLRGVGAPPVKTTIQKLYKVLNEITSKYMNLNWQVIQFF